MKREVGVWKRRSVSLSGSDSTSNAESGPNFASRSSSSGDFVQEEEVGAVEVRRMEEQFRINASQGEGQCVLPSRKRSTSEVLGVDLGGGELGLCMSMTIRCGKRKLRMFVS